MNNMLKKLYFALLLNCFSFGYSQNELNQIFFHFVNENGSTIFPDKIEITDNEGVIFQLVDYFCFDYPILSNYAFYLKVQDKKYYDYEIVYYMPNIPNMDTIVMKSIEVSSDKNISHAQNKSRKYFSMDDFIPIKIRAGYTVHGSMSVSLQREGFMYWRDFSYLSDLPEEERVERVKFIPFSELDIKKITAIMMFIWKEGLHEIKEVEMPPGVSISTSGVPMVLSFINLKKGTYNEFDYWGLNKRVDTLIQMMNELIPEEDREEFYIRIPFS